MPSSFVFSCDMLLSLYRRLPKGRLPPFLVLHSIIPPQNEQINILFTLYHQKTNIVICIVYGHLIE